MSRENRPLLDSDHCYTLAVMVKLLSSTSTRELFLLNDSQISGYFDTEFTAVVLLEPILQKIEDLKIALFLTPKRSIFL